METLLFSAVTKGTWHLKILEYLNKPSRLLIQGIKIKNKLNKETSSTVTRRKQKKRRGMKRFR